MSAPDGRWHACEDASGHRSARVLVRYGRLLGPLLAGYLLFDKAFAYLHLPGTPVYIGEIVLGVGVLGVLAATGHLRIPLRDEPVLAVLGAFVLWGAARSVPGVGEYGLDAVRDSALWYYALFAFLAVAALARSPELLGSLLTGLHRLTPWLLVWLPIAVILVPASDSAPTVPFTTVSILTHKSGNAAVAAVLVLGSLWLFPERRTGPGRALWGLLALLVIALVATQNRGGMLGAVAGTAVGLVFLRNRARLTTQALAVIAMALALATLLPIKVPFPGLQGREFSASQLIANIASVGGADSPGNLGGTVDGRGELWSKVLDKQIADGRLVDGSGFGPNLAAEVGVYDEGSDRLRSPHNSHLHILARMGIVGFVLWIGLWVGWCRRLVVGCRRLERHGQHARSRTAVLCLMVASAVLVSTFFDPQLEGPQIAVLLWTTFGIGVAVTSTRTWFTPGATAPGPLEPPGQLP